LLRAKEDRMARLKMGKEVLDWLAIQEKKRE
jgi:hypothetical protein